MNDLKQIAKEIREVIADYQLRHNLTFSEEGHIYSMGDAPEDMPSVSTVLENFYIPFDASSTGSFKKCGGDKGKEDELLAGWQYISDIASSTGSRTHFYSEKYSLAFSGIDKEVRKPIYECDEEQIEISNHKIEAAKKYVHLMNDRGAVMLDSEIILGNLTLEYYGQPDNVWLMKNKKGEVGIVITDWKTNSNEEKLITPFWYTKKMLSPFEYLDDLPINHYNIQLPLYGKLLKSMLKGSKFENINIFGGVIVLLREDETFGEYKIPSRIWNQTMNLDMKDYL